MKRPRVAWRLSLVVPMLLPALLFGSPPPSKAAGILPLGSCWDFRYFDNLVSSPAAAYCAGALKNAGYLAAGFHNKSAVFALARLAADGVFFFAGHALVAGNPNAAVSLMYESPAPGGKLDALVGPPAGLAFQGPVQVCNESGSSCRSANLVSYPWVHLLGKHNLVVLESCNTAGSNLVYAPANMTLLAKAAGAGTVVGFKAAVGFPLGGGNAYGIRWAQVFWGSLDAGADYASAVVAATNAVGCCGYSSWTRLSNPAAPTRLRPAKYYPAGGLRVGAASASVAQAGTASSDTRSLSLSRFLNRPVAASTWSTVERLGGARHLSIIPGLGMFELDRTLEVREAIFEKELSSPANQVAVRIADAGSVAEAFARSRFHGFDALSIRRSESLDHGDFREHRFEWQARSGEAWLPSRVTVGVNAVTGRIAYYSSDRAVVTVPTTSDITPEAARASALTASGLEEEDAVVSEPFLAVVRSTTGRQRLVWITEVSGRPQATIHLPTYRVMWTDAATGTSEVMARS